MDWSFITDIEWKIIFNKIITNFYLLFTFRSIVIILIFLVIKKISNKYLNQLSNKIISSKEPVGSRRSKRTRIAFLNKFITSVLLLIAVLSILAGLPQFKSFSYSLMASAGILAVIIGFATQKTLSNIISGIFLALYEPFRVGIKLRY